VIKNIEFQDELGIYLDLIKYGPKTISELQLLYNKSDEELNNAINNLEKMGLIRIIDSHYIPIPQLKPFLDEISGGISSLKKNIDDILASIKNFESKLFALSSEIKVKVQQLVKDYYNDISEEIDKISSDIDSSLNSSLEIMRSTISKTVNDMNDIITDFKKYNESLELTISELDLIKERVLKKAVSEIKEKVSMTIAELLSYMKKNLGELNDNLNAFRDVVSTELDKLLNMFHTHYSRLLESINGIKVSIVDLLKDQKSDIEEASSLISQELKQQIDALVEKVHLLNKEISKFLSTFLSDLKEGMERFSSNAKRRITALEDSLGSILDTSIDNYAQKLQVQVNSIKDNLIRILNGIQINFDISRKGIGEKLSKSSLEIKDKVASTLTKTTEDIANNINKINELISEKLMSINSLFSEIFEQSVNTLLEITKSYEEIIIQELESLYKEILTERKEILDKINQNLVNLSEKITSLHSALEEYEISMEKEAASKLNTHLDEIMGKIDGLVQDYAIKMEGEINNFSKRIVNEISRIIAKTLLKSKKEKELLAKNMKEISNELDVLDNITKKLEIDLSGKENEALSELISRINSIKKRAKRMTLNIERSGRVNEDELVKIKENVVILMDDAAKRYTKEILSTLLTSIKTALKNYLNARVEELIKIYGEKLKDFREKFKMEINWITASLSNLSSELKSEIERGDQAIFGIFDAISRRSIGIGRKVISERESEVELLQNKVRSELSLMSKEISELLQQNTSAITSEFKEISQDISSIVDNVSKEIESTLNKLIEGALNRLDSAQQEMLLNLDGVTTSLRGTLDEFRKSVITEANQVIEKTSELLERYYQTFESKTVKSLESVKSNVDMVIEDMISTIDTNMGLINNKLIERLSKLANETSNYTQLINKDFSSFLNQAEKQYNEKKSLIDETKNNVLNKATSISSDIEKLSMNLDNYYKDETRWFNKDYIDVMKSNILEIYGSIRDKVSSTKSNFEETIGKIDELLNVIETNEDKYIDHHNSVKEFLNKVLNGVKEGIKENFSELTENIVTGVNSIIEKMDEINYIRKIHEEKTISKIIDEISSNYERVLNLDELLSKNLGNYIEKAKVTIGKESVKVYLHSALKSANSFVLIMTPEKIDFTENEELHCRHDIHVEIIAPQRIISDLKNISNNKLFLLKANKTFNFMLIIRDNEEALFGIKRADTWINYLFKEKNIIDNLRELVTQVL